MPEQFLFVFQIYILSDKTLNSGNTLSNEDAQFFSVEHIAVDMYACFKSVQK